MKRNSAVLACAALLAVAAGAYAQPQTQSRAQVAPAASHTVRKGDTLFGISREFKHDGVSQYQMIFGIWRANKDAFPEGNINRLEVGTVLAIPSPAEIAEIDAAQAPKLVHELLDAHMGPPARAEIAPLKPMAPGTRPDKPGQEESARRFSMGQSLERKGDHEGALRAYLEAGEAGYGRAQVRLGEIYDKGSPATPRDYETSLLWYERARDQGIQLPKPLQRTIPVR